MKDDLKWAYALEGRGPAFDAQLKEHEVLRQEWIGLNAIICKLQERRRSVEIQGITARKYVEGMARLNWSPEEIDSAKRHCEESFDSIRLGKDPKFPDIGFQKIRIDYDRANNAIRQDEGAGDFSASEGQGLPQVGAEFQRPTRKV